MDLKGATPVPVATNFTSETRGSTSLNLPKGPAQSNVSPFSIFASRGDTDPPSSAFTQSSKCSISCGGEATE